MQGGNGDFLACRVFQRGVVGQVGDMHDVAGDHTGHIYIQVRGQVAGQGMHGDGFGGLLQNGLARGHRLRLANKLNGDLRGHFVALADLMEADRLKAARDGVALQVVHQDRVRRSVTFNH